jgi:hypothetical protein
LAKNPTENDFQNKDSGRAKSDSLETNEERKYRKSAEKMAIRVEGSISKEDDGQGNRMAATSAKCAGNKARWNFYDGRLELDEAAMKRLLVSE